MPSCRFQCKIEPAAFNLFQPCIALLQADQELLHVVSEKLGLRDEANDLETFVRQVIVRSVNRSDGGLIGKLICFVASR